MKILRVLLALAASALALAPRLEAQTLASDLTVQRTVTLQGDISPAQITADQNNYAPTGLSTATVLRLNSDASRNLTGLTAGADGRFLIVCNVGSFPIVLVNESASSTAANRFSLVANFSLSAGGCTVLVYDITSARWRQIFGAPTSGSGTVTSVSLTGFSGITVTGSPVTTSGGFTLSTTLSGVLKGTGSGFAAATAGTDYVAPGLLTASGLTSSATSKIFGRVTAGAGAAEELTTSQTKTLLSLNNVENTALSTWTGSSAITTLGTITTGNWTASAVTAPFGGTGFSSYAIGDMLYASATNAFSVLSGTTAFGRSLLTQANGPAVQALIGSAFNTRVAKTAGYTVVSTDRGVYFDCTSGTFTLDLTAAATLGNGFNFFVFNSGSGVITIDPATTETIRDATSSATTKTLAQGEGGIVVCDAAGWSFLKVTAGGAGASGANPTGTIGLTAVNGVATSYVRSDGAPALSQAIVPTWTGVHTFTPQVVLTGGYSLPGGGAVTGASGGSTFTASGTNQGFSFLLTGTGSGAGQVSIGTRPSTIARSAFAIYGTTYDTTKLAVRAYQTDGTTAALNLGAANGTLGSPAATGFPYALGYINYGGHDGTATWVESSVYLAATTTQAWSSSQHGSKLQIAVTPNGSTTIGIQYTFDQDGALLLGTTTNDGVNKLQVSGTAKIFGTTASTTTATGSLINAGGFGNAGALFTGSLNVTGTTITKLRHGTATLVAGTVTVSDTATTTSTRIFVNRLTDGGTLGDSFSVTRSAATSFTITAKTANVTAASDTSIVAYLAIEP